MFLYKCTSCQNGDHESCERVRHTSKGMFGGTKCICPCNGRSKEQMKKDWEKHYRKIMEAEM